MKTTIASFASLVLLLTGCVNYLNRTNPVNLVIPGKLMDYEYSGYQNGPDEYNNYQPKAGNKFFTIFLNVSNRVTNEVMFDMSSVTLKLSDGNVKIPAFTDRQFGDIMGDHHYVPIPASKLVKMHLVFVMDKRLDPAEIRMPNGVRIQYAVISNKTGK